MQNAKVDINITKVAIIGIATIATLGVAYFIWKKIEKGVEGLSDRVEAKDVVAEAEKNVERSNLTYDQLFYESAADKVFTAMEGIGTDEWSIQSIMRSMKNIDDVRALISKFGVRKGKAGVKEFTGNLTQWLNHEMNSIDIWLMVNQPLKNNGINFKF